MNWERQKLSFFYFDSVINSNWYTFQIQKQPSSTKNEQKASFLVSSRDTVVGPDFMWRHSSSLIGAQLGGIFPQENEPLTKINSNIK